MGPRSTLGMGQKGIGCCVRLPRTGLGLPVEWWFSALRSSATEENGPWRGVWKLVLARGSSWGRGWQWARAAGRGLSCLGAESPPAQTWPV